MNSAVVAVGAVSAAEGTGGTWEWVLLWAYLLLALGVSFLCSLLEASILSLTPSYTSLLVQRGQRSGRMLQQMKSNIDQPLAAILTLNTVAHTVGAAGVGAQAAAIFGRQWIGVISAVLTFLILILSEIVPKTMGAVGFKRLAGFTAYTVQGMIWLLWPLVKLCMVISQWIGGAAKQQGLTREEVASLAHLGRKEGALRPDEFRLMQNMMTLRAIRVRDIMTPRNVVYMLPAEKTVGDLLSGEEVPAFARIPIYDQQPDQLIGIVSRYEIVRCYHAGELETTMRALAQPLVAVPETATVADALYQFSQKQQQLFQVADEYGGTAGIITFEDAIESLLGIEIVDETDPVADMQQLAKARRAQRLKQLAFITDRTAQSAPPRAEDS
jgi:CBS domain containing-hemolysin-like protein